MMPEQSYQAKKLQQVLCDYTAEPKCMPTRTSHAKLGLERNGNQGYGSYSRSKRSFRSPNKFNKTADLFSP